MDKENTYKMNEAKINPSWLTGNYLVNKDLVYGII